MFDKELKIRVDELEKQVKELAEFLESVQNVLKNQFAIDINHYIDKEVQP